MWKNKKNCFFTPQFVPRASPLVQIAYALKNAQEWRFIMDERQYMINDRYEIFEKYGVTNARVTLHYHTFYEVIHIIDGVFVTDIDGKTYHLKAGDFLLVDVTRMHRPIFDDERTHKNHRIVLWITKEMLNSLSGGEMELKGCFTGEVPAYHFPLHAQHGLSSLLKKILVCEKDDVVIGKNLLINSYMTEFFVLLNRYCITNEFSSVEQSASAFELIKKVTDYVDQHIEDVISMEELAAHVFLSKYHFLRTFKAQANITVHEFIMKKRLIKACDLMDQGMQITEVYKFCGFRDYSTFFRNFKSRFGINPGQWHTEK